MPPCTRAVLVRSVTAAFLLSAASLFSAAFLLSAALPALAAEREKPRILFVISTGGFHHSSCEHSAGVILNMARTSGLFDVVCANTTELLDREALKGFDAVFFSNTTGDLKSFPAPKESVDALLDFIREGGAFIGSHAASDTLKDYEAYYDMIGGSFNGHPWHEDVTIEVEDPSHPAAWPLPSPWRIKDEIYIFKNFSRDDLNVILRLKEAPPKGRDGEHDPAKRDYALAWSKTYGKGRVFYTALGHREDVWDNPLFQEHLLGGIRWALRIYSDKPALAPLARAEVDLDRPGAIGHGPVKSEWRRIFDGENLRLGTDWETTDDPAVTRAHWTVEPGGILQGTGEGSSHIYYIKEKFRNFEYRADISISPDGNSGMYFRCAEENRQPNGQWRNWPAGYEAQINNGYGGDPKRSGTFYPKPTLYDADIQKLIGYEKAKDDGDVWFQMHVIAVDDLFVIKLNGKLATAHRDGRFKEGHFAFQMHHTGTVVRLKNIEVRELP